MMELLIQSYPVEVFGDYAQIYQEIQGIPLHAVRKNRIKVIAKLIDKA